MHNVAWSGQLVAVALGHKAGLAAQDPVGHLIIPAAHRVPLDAHKSKVRAQVPSEHRYRPPREMGQGA